MHLIRCPNKYTWNTAFSNDMGRLAQCVGNRVKGGKTIFFIRRSAVPAGKRVTYGRIVVSIRTSKAETQCVRITVVGDRLSYEGTTAKQCASLITTKILLNSVVSTILSMFMCANVNDFYYNTPMVDLELHEPPPQNLFPRNHKIVQPIGHSCC